MIIVFRLICKANSLSGAHTDEQGRKAEMIWFERCPPVGNATSLGSDCFGFFCVCLQIRQVFNLTNSKRKVPWGLGSLFSLSLLRDCSEKTLKWCLVRFQITPPKPVRLYIAVTWTGTVERLSADFILKGALLFAYPEKVSGRRAHKA